MSTARILARCLAAATFMILGCREGSVEPPKIGEVHVAIVSGDGQTGSPGQELSQPLIVRVVGVNGKGIRGQLVNFRVTVGGGRLYAGSSLTDMNGVAQDYWTLGTPGPQQVEVVAVDPTTGSKQNFGTFNATALLPATLTVTPSSANLGTVAVGSTAGPTVFTVQNVGNETSGGVTPSLGGAHATDFTIGATTCAGPLAGGATCTVSVSFTPLAAGARVATLTVAASPGGSVSATVSGTGSAIASLVITPPAFNFGSQLVNVSTTTASFTVQNTGNAPAATLGTTVSGTNPGDFIIVGNTCSGVTLSPGQGCTLGVQFRPTASGARSASLDVSANGGVSTAASLSGTGIAPAQLSISPTSYVFLSEEVGSFGETRTFFITNSGQQSTGIVAISVTGANAQDFLIPMNMCLQVILQPGQSCPVTIGFQPSAVGARTATLVATASPGGSASAALSGVGTSTTPVVTISPTSSTLGSTVIGATSAPQLFTVRNGGGGVTGALSLVITGTAASAFALTNDNCTGVTLSGGSTCTVSVTFSPTVPGTNSATLIATATPGGNASSSLTATGLSPATLSLSPGTFNFGVQPVGVPSRLQTFTITNTGGSPTGSLQSGITGPHANEFTITRNTCGAALMPTTSCQIDVVFTPLSSGTRQATLGVSASPGGSASASLTGTGS
jgi:hypothetical protein